MARTWTTLNDMTLLDTVRNQYGATQLRNEFYGQYMSNPDNAVNLLNAENLQFPSLYMLQPEISKLHLEPELNARNSTALEISKGFISDKKHSGFKYNPKHAPIMQWMFKTGCKETDLGDEYDEIMDLAAIILIRELHDRSCLRPLEELIFLRHRKGTYTYDAEWALFESKDPECLALIAKRLLSSDRHDVELAKKMLGFIPCFNLNTNEPDKLFNCVMKWLSENKPYLRYTGENNQKGDLPRPYEVSFEAKYFHMPYSGQSDFNNLSINEAMRVNRFLGLDTNIKVLLSDFSSRLYSSNRKKWRKWMRSSLPSQIETSSKILGRGASK